MADNPDYQDEPLLDPVVRCELRVFDLQSLARAIGRELNDPEWTADMERLLQVAEKLPLRLKGNEDAA